MGGMRVLRPCGRSNVTQGVDVVENQGDRSSFAVSAFVTFHELGLQAPRSEVRDNVGEGRCRYTRDEGRSTMDALAEKLDGRLREWKPETAAEARERITEVIELADHDILDIARSRAAEQEVLDVLDEHPTR